MSESTLTSKGQVTLPKDIRDALALQEGDRVSFILEGPRRVRMEPASLSVKELRGAVKVSRKKPVSLESMAKAIRKRGSGS